MFNRRGLFKLVLGALVAPSLPKPGPRLLPMLPRPRIVPGFEQIPVRKMMARVRITQEMLDDVRAGAFGDFMRGEFAQAAQDAARREELQAEGKIVGGVHPTGAKPLAEPQP